MSHHAEIESIADARVELESLDNSISELKVKFEQYFSGLQPQPPDKPYAAVRRRIRMLRKAPFKSAGVKFKLRSIEARFNTYNTYWQRVLREKEEGTYAKDLFKVELREKTKSKEAFLKTKEGEKQQRLQGLFQSYKNALELNTGKQQHIDYQAFEKALVQKMKEVKKAAGGAKVSFKVVSEGGKVQLKATLKSP